MVKQKGKRATKLTAILLSLMMVVVFVPTFAFADTAADITVFMTVSDEGELATDNDDEAMAWKEVTVKDIDGDGHFTFDEALVAAHAAYNSADGYVASGDYVKKLWGTETSACMFFNEGQAIPNGVSSDEVADGDYLTVAILSDDETYGDYYSQFESPTEELATGETSKFKLVGHDGMGAIGEADFELVEGAEVGIWNDGEFVPIGETDENGEISYAFNEPGTYILTADFEIEDVVVNAGDEDGGFWYLIKSGRDLNDKPYYGHTDWDTYESTIGYTRNDYGDGPYPADEIEWIDITDFDINEWTTEDGYLLYSGYLKVDGPSMAPACVVTVVDSTTDEYVASLAKEKQAIIDGLTQVDFSQLSQGDQMNAVMTLIASIAKVNAATTKKALVKAVEDAVVSITAVTTKIEGFSAKKGKKKATLKWTKGPENTFDGYQIYYKKAKAKAETLVEVADPETTSVVITKLSKKKKYTFKVRGYKTVDGQPVYGAWSAAKTIKIK